ncbi:hypothetical protein TRV_01369, partial [Trichophyton verrucosum HKI 0517]
HCSCGNTLEPYTHIERCSTCLDIVNGFSLATLVDAIEDIGEAGSLLASVDNRGLWVTHDTGDRSIICPHCRAIFWDEKLPKQKRDRFFLCCKNGGLDMHEFAGHSPIPEPPVDSPIGSLFCDNNPQNEAGRLGRLFRRHIRHVNNSLAFTAITARKSDCLRAHEHTYIYQIQGTTYHKQGPLEARPGQEPAFAQLYFLSPQKAMSRRLANIGHVRYLPEVVSIANDYIRAHNPYYRLFRCVREVLQENIELGHVRLTPSLRLMKDPDSGQQYDLPVSQANTEIAGFIPDIPHEYGDTGYRDVLLYLKEAPDLTRGEADPFISHIRNSLTDDTDAAAPAQDTQGRWFSYIHFEHPLYLPLHYVLFYATGGRGHNRSSILRSLTTAGAPRRNKQVTIRSFSRWHLWDREGSFNILHRGAALFQQFVVDIFLSVDMQRLQYFYYNQKTIRAELYQNTRDMMAAEATPDSIGRRILPATFTGSVRNMQQHYQDSMAIVQHYGKPAFFVTFTANPHWPEIANNLLKGSDGTPQQVWNDRPDLVSRVFNLKNNAMIDIFRKGHFGKYRAHVQVIEWQKRGLPHSHTLFWIDGAWDNPEYIDKFVLDDNGKPQPCSKVFPKKLRPDTILTSARYAEYRRRDQVRTDIPHPNLDLRRTIPTVQIHDSWVAPYSPYLCSIFNAHINVESCASLGSVRYIHKYIHKGSDRATVEFDSGGTDEIKQYVSGRYMGAMEAAWRLFGFSIHSHYPPVLPLVVHLPSQQTVVWDQSQDTQDMLEQIDRQVSQLDAFFSHNRGHSTEKLLYQEMASRYVWDRKCWKPRKQESRQIGRMHPLSPVQNAYYIRCLLTVEACYALGLLAGDDEWTFCFKEACQLRTGTALRMMFVSALSFGSLDKDAALRIWSQFGNQFCDDLSLRISQGDLNYPSNWTMEKASRDLGLYFIYRLLQQEEHSLEEFGLPMFENDWEGNGIPTNPLIAAELAYNRAEQEALAEQLEAQLNTDQQRSYGTILEALEQIPEKTLFFLNGPGGTGKTFLYRTICARIRSQGLIVLCVASTGIASTLLPGGRTAHKRFKIPIPIEDHSTCNISRSSQLAELLQQTSLLIWDDTSMTSAQVFNAVDRSLRDIRQVDSPFGGLPTILGGDFQQILPVIPMGTQQDIIDATMHNANVWRDLRILSLRENMRLRSATSENRAFAEWLARLTIDESLQGWIRLHPVIKSTTNLTAFTDWAYPNLAENSTNPEFFKDRAIVTSLNENVRLLNQYFLAKFPREVLTRYAINTTDINDAAHKEVSREFLQSPNSGSPPPSKLRLKIGVPIMLLRNLNPSKGLCNRTRFILRRALHQYLEVQINSGDFDRNIHPIYRVRHESNALDFPFKLYRH